MLYCTATEEYQCGRIDEATYYDRLAKGFQVRRDEVVASFHSVNSSVTVKTPILSSLASLKARLGDTLKIYAMANLSKDDFSRAQSLPIDWTVFDDVFISGELGMRKPEIGFYKHVLRRINMRPEQIIVIDDEVDHVLMALSMGMRAILYNSSCISQTLSNLVEHSATERGQKFLRASAKQFQSETECGVRFKENFAQLLMLETTRDECVSSRCIYVQKGLLNCLDLLSSWRSMR